MMKTACRIVMGMMVVSGCLRLHAQTAPALAAQWKLVWSDEFEGRGLPDTNKWDYEEGFVRNQEKQFYTRARLENARVEDGCLVIEARKERFPNSKYQPGSSKWNEKAESADYTSASLMTLHKAAWKYGRIEVRAQLPQGRGQWPAIWTLGENRSAAHWPLCGEIDIMENVGKEPDGVHANVHFSVDGKHRSAAGTVHSGGLASDFHVYAIEWNHDRIDFFFDGKLYHHFDVDQAGPGEENPFRKPQYLILNLALGGSWGGPIDDAVLPQKYRIDYVRVYEPQSQR